MEKQKYHIEFDFKSIPPPLLWSYIATPSGLREWFADDVVLQGKRFIFKWNDGTEQTASIVSQRVESSLRLRWTGDSLSHYFEFKIMTGEMTDSTTLLLTDFSTSEEVDDARELWMSQIDNLRIILGC
ncbi:START-like domain-containing protein [uncultured Muribaculum sp.]|uniref:START-like domain-containing protein n=1 Tax=uncultured Muribaculum sp. TaxID=1918613 RepID=UPI00261676AB|nr:START-like domain-containing protein [uncultured Muribaculum sp.]